MFVVQQVEEKGRLDRWEIFLKKLQPASELEISYKDMYPLYGVVVPISSRTYLVSGGVIGRHVDNMKATNACFMLLLSHDLK